MCLLVVSFSLIAETPRRDFPDSLNLPAYKLVEIGPPFTWELGSSYYLSVATFVLTHIIAAVLVGGEGSNSTGPQTKFNPEMPEFYEGQRFTYYC